MILTLQVIAPAGDAIRRTFTHEGGTLGRAGGNSLVLTHNKVSARHAIITFLDGYFYIEDTSRNGVAINAPDNRIGTGRPYALKAGDRIFVEPYEIDVSIDAGPGRALRAAQPPLREAEDPFASDPWSPLGSPPLDRPAEAEVGGEVDPIMLLGGHAEPGPGRARPADPIPSLHEDPMGDHYGPPAPVHDVFPDPFGEALGPGAIPPDYNPLNDLSRPEPGPRQPANPGRPPDRVKSAEVLPVRPVASDVSAPPAPAPPVQPLREPPRRPQSSGDDLAVMLVGAGLSPEAVTPELTRTFGEILRVVVAGVMDVLQSRQSIKEEFRMRQTSVRPTDNNPLKFSANVDDALHNLLVKRNAAYMGPVDAFADAFQELRNHQLAMLAGMRVAFEALLAEFDPDRLQEQFDRQLGKGSIVPAKLRYWDLYRERRRDMVQDPEATFARLFGEEFARAYEEQFRKLRADPRM